MINEQTVKLKVASTSVEYARWGEITGNIESQTDLMNMLGERDLEEVQETITQGLSDIDTAKEEAIEEIRQSGGGFTADVKNALLNCFQKVAWIDENGQTYYDALYNALYPPVEVRTLTAVLNASGHTFYVGDSIEDLRAYLTVTAELSTGQTVTVNDYTLSGSLSYAGENIITVTYSGKSTTVTVNAISVELVSISAVYTQSGTVYDTDSLDSLKSDLVVTATYSDSSTETVPSADYTLSGTLAEGTSTITVTYEGLTATFSVTVTVETALYSFENGTHTFGDNSVLTVSDGHHVKYECKVSKTGSGTGNPYFNISKISFNGTNVNDPTAINYKPTWFNIPANSEVVLSLKNVTATSGSYKIQVNMRKADSTTGILSGPAEATGASAVKTQTITTSTDVSGLYAFFDTCVADVTYEFDVELRVDGVRYI